MLQKNIRIWSPDIIPYLIRTLSKEVLMLLNNKSSAKQIACKFPIVFFGCRWIIFCSCVMLRWMILIDYLLQVKLRLDSQTRFFFFLIPKCRLNRALSNQDDAYLYRKHVFCLYVRCIAHQDRNNLKTILFNWNTYVRWNTDILNVSLYLMYNL